jgi:hypothetical protein
LRNTQFDARIEDRLDVEKLDGPIEEEKQDAQSAENPAGPHQRLRETSGLNLQMHEKAPFIGSAVEGFGRFAGREGGGGRGDHC